MKSLRLVPVLVVGLSLGCHNSTATAPSTATTTTTTDVASPTMTDTFSGTLPVGGSTFFPFTVGQYGTVNATLAGIGGPGVPSTVQVRLGLGNITDSSCSTSTMSIVAASTATEVTATDQPGTYCVDVSDVGNLFEDATVSLTVAHP